MLDKKGLLNAFEQIKCKRDTVIVHSSYKSLGGIDGGAETVIDVLLDFVGEKGTVLFPTFNFSCWTEDHYFDILETPSRMGIISELSRFRDGCCRTSHPIYSFSVLGRRRDEFMKCNDLEAFGCNSVFAMLHKLDACIISIGLDFNNSFTFHHYIEYMVGCNYRRVKLFGGIYIGYSRIPYVKVYSMFVRADFNIKTYITPGMIELFNRGIIKKVSVGKATVHYVSCKSFFNNMSKIVIDNPEKLHYIDEKYYEGKRFEG